MLSVVMSAATSSTASLITRSLVVAPLTVTSWIANQERLRNQSVYPAHRARIRTPAAIKRRRSTAPLRFARGRVGARPTGRRGFSARVATPPDSPRELPFLRPAHLAEHLNLRLENDAERLVDPAACRRHHSEDVSGGRVARVLDEVRVLQREPRASDLEAAAARGVEQLSRRASVGAGILRVHEGGAKRLDPRGLGLLSPPAHVRHRLLHVHGIRMRERDGTARHHLAIAEVRPPVAEAQLLGPAIRRTGGRADRHRL